MPRAVKREHLVEAELVARVRALGGIAEKVQAIGRRGFFDRLVILPGGRIFFVEVKRPYGGRLSPHQIWYLKEFDALGVAIAVVRNSEDITRLLNERGPGVVPPGPARQPNTNKDHLT